ncbi:B-type lectin plumieribetin-like [Poeciliopsis prolifica]|uniref:B-type lectin plumieribetin-like n=1 Tax=Poeciliopsis prolifica TaxID=188132 RepID=UPI002413E9BF|nr:B-type lectin plumieribetin-like [Poeciliopsis prolifica]
MSRNYLSNNEELRRGDYLLSNNGEWKAVFQNDGNFVIYGWQPTWSSDTYQSDVVRLIMQADRNLVMYNDDNKPRWHTGTYLKDSHVGRVQLTDDGKLLVYSAAKLIWSSADSKGMRV